MPKNKRFEGEWIIETSWNQESSRLAGEVNEKSMTFSCLQSQVHTLIMKIDSIWWCSLSTAYAPTSVYEKAKVWKLIMECRFNCVVLFDRFHSISIFVLCSRGSAHGWELPNHRCSFSLMVTVHMPLTSHDTYHVCDDVYTSFFFDTSPCGRKSLCLYHVLDT